MIYGDFYDNYTEFDKQMQEFEDALKLSVKKEFLDEMAMLKEENAKLQDIKKNWKKLQNEVDNQKRELKIAQENAYREAKRLRLKELFEGSDFNVVLYRADYKLEFIKKCNKCDDERRIEYVTPLGKKAFEDCECNKQYKVYKPKTYQLVEFSKQNTYGETFNVWFKPFDSGNDGYGSAYIKNEYIYQKNAKFQDLKEEWHRYYFRDKKDCQEFCDYLNGLENHD